MTKAPVLYARFQSLPVVVYTSPHHLPDRERSQTLGASDYWVKPSLRADVVKLMQQLKARWLHLNRPETTPRDLQQAGST